MRVGVYIDGYNLYYGGKKHCDPASHWKWLDIRALVSDVVSAQRIWPDAQITRIVYCTARIDARLNANGHQEQDVYLKALLATGSVDWIEYGTYVSSVRARPLAVRGQRPSDPPVVSRSQWPVMVQSHLGIPVPDAHFMVSTLHQEEKGSDVNVAVHMVSDVLERTVDAVVVVSNDSDLALPVKKVRGHVPTGVVNPRGGRIAGDLAGRSHDGVGAHWWRNLSAEDFTSHQLPDPANGFTRPEAW